VTNEPAELRIEMSKKNKQFQKRKEETVEYQGCTFIQQTVTEHLQSIRLWGHRVVPSQI
jgi:acetate kinase